MSLFLLRNVKFEEPESKVIILNTQDQIGSTFKLSFVCSFM